MKFIPCFLVIVLFGVLVELASGAEIYIRINQVAYASNSPKIAIAISQENLPSNFSVIDSHDAVVLRGQAQTVSSSWGKIAHHAELNFSSLRIPGIYQLRIGSAQSLPVRIAVAPYARLSDQLLQFMREQRCGDNPWFTIHCHQLDGRTAYGPRPFGTAIDVTGGWHDAGDTLKYLMTSQDATTNMLLAYQILNPHGTSQEHQQSSLLAEARWGLEWMLKMHPSPAELYHQVGDDRDHNGWRLPQNDPADYGFGKGGARVVYCADGRPQGLGKYKSASTGMANLAGVYAAAMALAFEIYHDDPAERSFAVRCLQAGKEVYALGREHPGVQQGNSYSSPYRYSPTIWAQDMEWGAAELFRATHEQSYLEEAKRYAVLANDETWMGKTQTAHYQYFPFINIGHYRLYDLVEHSLQKKLVGYYRSGIDACVQAGELNPYHVGVPFIWCSNNLVVALATQCQLYAHMTGDHRYGAFAARQRDWLLGRNPWGIVMFTEIGQTFPRDVHLASVQLLHRPVAGALVDGPVYEHIFQSLHGVFIQEPDPLAAFQGLAVYHDDGHDYSTNEPTLDGTASALLLLALENADP